MHLKHKWYYDTAEMSKLALEPTRSPIQWVPGSFPGVNRMVVGVMLNTHLHLAPRLRMIGGIQILPLYVFIAWAWITSPFYLYLLFGSIILLTVVIVKQGIFGENNFFNTSCKSCKLSRFVTFSQNFIPLELSQKLVNIYTLIFTFSKTIA
jgi:hypothetical protein